MGYFGGGYLHLGADALLSFERARDFYGPIGPRMIRPPAGPVLDLEMTQKHLRIEQDDEDVLLDLWMRAAEDKAQQFRNEVFLTQTWELTLPRFPAPHQPIPLFPKPVQSIESITYLDQGGVRQTFGTLDGSPETIQEYTLIDPNERPRIALAFDQIWPETAMHVQDNVHVRIVCGYGDARDNVPSLIQAGMLLLCGHFYENREAVVVGQGYTGQEIPLGIRALLEIPRAG